MSVVSEKAEKHFPSHTDIGMEVEGIVHGNAFFDEHQHNRETLDDLISDLIQYRDSIPTAEDYEESGRL
jgi:hypothetical protein